MSQGSEVCQELLYLPMLLFSTVKIRLLKLLTLIFIYLFFSFPFGFPLNFLLTDRAMSAALAAGGAGKRKSRFSGAELEVLVSEVTRCEGELFGPAGRLRRRERERIWAGILERVNAVSRVPRTLREVKKRWDDLKRRNGGRLADARHRSCYLPSSRGTSMLGRPSQPSPRLQQARQKQSTRPKPSFPCFADSDTGKLLSENCLSF